MINRKQLLKISLACLFCLTLYYPAMAQRPGGGPRPPQQPLNGMPPPPGRRPGMPGRRPEGPPPPPRPDATLDFASTEMLGRKVIKDIPYSAEALIETTQVLGDGTRISRKSDARVARDKEGRLRREIKLDTIGPFTTAEDTPVLIIIDDPLQGVHYVLNEPNKTARKVRNPPPPPDADEEERGAFAEGKVESLGTKTIEGVEAEGTRAVITIPEGQIGNDRQIQIVSERWFSPALQVVVLSKHSDPRMGETTYRLVNIRREEPDAELFKVPADYSIRDVKPPKPPRAPGQRPNLPPPPDRPF